MNSHIVEKTMHSIKNIDRLTDLAAIDVYNTTHDTINKYEIMKEHATEEYTNESFYQESVLAGVLIGAGILGVAISAFFIIKKIIDSKSKVTTKNSDGSTSVAVDLSDPKSTEKFIAKLKERANKLNADTKVTTSQSIDPKAAEEEINLLEIVVEAFQNIIDSKDDTAKIKEILKGLKTDTNFDELTNKAFVSGDKEITLGNYVEELGIGEMVNFSKKINELKTKCDKAEKTINGMKANNENNSSTEGITDAEIKTLKDFSTKVAKALDSMLNKSNAICSSANTILDQAEEDAKKPKEEVKPETSEAKKKDEEAKSAEKSDGTGAAENKTETATGENKTGEQSVVDNGSEAGGNDNTGTKLSTSENVMGPRGQTEQTKQASEAREAAEAAKAQNTNVLYLNPKGDTQKDATENRVIPAAAEAKANEKTLEDVINMLKSGKPDEDVTNYLKLNNYSDDQIKDFLAKAKETINGPKNKIIQALMAKGKSPTIAQNIANEICDKYNNDLVQYMNAQIAANPGNDKNAVWAKNEAYKNCMIIATTLGIDINTIPTPDGSVSEPPEPEKKPEDQVKTEPENSPAPTDQNADENAQKTTPEQSSENQQQTQPQQNVNQNPNGINIKDMDNIIQQASYDGISKDISESICKNVIDDISSNTPFNVANRVKDEAVKLKIDQKLYFTDAAKRILRVYANAIADIEPQTDAVKKYAEDVKQASEMDLSLIEPPVISRGSLEPPKEYVNKVATLIKQIPGAIPNKAKELAESEYGDREKNDMANDIAKQLDEPEATNFRNAYASVINGSATGNIDENQLSQFGDAAAAVNTNNSANQQDQSNNSQNSITGPQESINAINEDITRAIENARLSDTAKQDLFKISGENIINSIVQSIEQLGGKQAQPEQVCSMVNGTLCNRVYKLMHDAIMQDRKFLQRPVFNTMSKYGEAVTTLCSQVRDICAKMLVSYYNIPVNMVDQIVVPFESYKNDKTSVMYKWFREYDIDVIRDKKIQMIMESQQQQEEQKSE